jgi:hypothetical protein
MTPCTSAQIRRKQERQRRKCLKPNKITMKYRVCVEHAMAEIKRYSSISSVWRHKWNVLQKIIYNCTFYQS